MQLADNNQCEVDRLASRETQGIVMPAVETLTIASIGKYLIGLVLAPWLWYERKRVDKLTEKLEGFYTKEEVKEKIEDKLAPMRTDLSWIRQTMEREYGNK